MSSNMYQKSSGRSVSDSVAESEAYSALMSTIPLSAINDEHAFYELVELYDHLLGRERLRAVTINDIINDKTRYWYIYLTSSIVHSTMFSLRELVIILRKMKEIKENLRTGSSFGSFKADGFKNAIVAFCRHSDFEPEWHMKKRGDTRPLLCAKEKDLWGYLRRLYTDPEASRLRIPDYVKKCEKMYPGYMECVKSAIVAGHEELKRVYGKDVDLSPVTELKSKDGIDYGEINDSFISIIQGTSI